MRGKAIKERRTHRLNWDHPRLCGEKFCFYTLMIFLVGSPPPMRGKVLFLHVDDIPCRITPAYAGKSICRCESYAICWDHPRLCGEKGVILVNSGAVAGSPPPMRGKVVVSAFHDLFERITPAYAGKSLYCPASRRFLPDHPRLCGEKDTADAAVGGIIGSPPPMRGKAP